MSSTNSDTGPAEQGKPDRAAMVASLAELSSEATSPDGTVTVSVNTDGVLTRLRLTAAINRMSPTEVANAVLRTYAQAQRDSAQRSGELLGPAARSGYVADRLRWRLRFEPDLQSTTRQAPHTPGAATRGHATHNDPHNARNEYLKDRSGPEYDLVPPLPDADEPRSRTDDDWYADGFRVKRDYT